MSFSARQEVVTNFKWSFMNGIYIGVDPSVMRFDGHSASPVQVAGRTEFGLNYTYLTDQLTPDVNTLERRCAMDFKFISSVNDLYLKVAYPPTRGQCWNKYLPDRPARPAEVWAIDGAGSASSHAMRRVLCCLFQSRSFVTLVSPLLTAAATNTPELLPPRARRNPSEPPHSPLHPCCHLRSSLSSHAAQRMTICACVPGAHDCIQGHARLCGVWERDGP